MKFLWLHLILLGFYKEINQLLVNEHLFVDCDRDFVLIKKQKQVSKCYLPEDLNMTERVL